MRGSPGDIPSALPLRGALRICVFQTSSASYRNNQLLLGPNMHRTLLVFLWGGEVSACARTRCSGRARRVFRE